MLTDSEKKIKLNYTAHIDMYICSKHCLFFSCIMGKPVFGVSDLVQHKLDCTATEDGWKPEILSLEKKTKALISSAVTAQLICAFTIEQVLSDS